VNGTNFINGSVVRWNGANRITTFINGTSLSAAIPASDIANAGSANVTVFNPTPGGGTSQSLLFNITSNSNQTYSMLSPSTLPADSLRDPNPVELGLKFRSDAAGVVTAIRFYKPAISTGTHSGHLWTSAGVLLGSVNFTSETASGWQQANFTTPISISANTTY